MAFAPPELRIYDELRGKTFLVCVGAMKCATSWIHGYLGDLPEVTVTPLKELHFFDARFQANALGDMEALALKRVGMHLERNDKSSGYLRGSAAFQASIDRVQMIYDDNAYFGHFARICTPETRTLCDITPAYSAIGPDGFAYMKSFFEAQGVTLKIVYVMRDPVDRFWSQLRHMQEVNPKSEITTDWARAIASPQVLARADYKGTIWDLDNSFEQDDILYLFYEHLFFESSLRALCTTAGAEYRPGKITERQNQTRFEADLPDDARAAFRDLLDAQYRFCRERFGDRVPQVWAS